MIFFDYLFLSFVAISLYFLILSLLLALEGHESPQGTDPLPSVSLIVPAYNEGETIAATLESLLELEYPPGLLEIIVVDDGSTDDTFQLASSYPVKLLRQENSGKAAAVNNGIENSGSEIVGVVDADSFPERGSLRLAVSYFSSPNVAAVTSSVLVKDPGNLLTRLQEFEYFISSWERSLLTRLGCVPVTPGPLSLYRRSVLDEVGGFDPSVLTEDIEVAWRILAKGYEIKMSHGSRVYTKAPASLPVWWRQRLRWNIGGLQTALKYKGSFFSRGSGLFGFFIAPKFVLFNLLTVLGFFLFMNSAYNSLRSFLDYLRYVDVLGLDLLDLLGFELALNSFSVLSAILAGLALLLFFICLASMGRKIKGRKDLLSVLVFQTIYFLLSPLVLLHSIWRLISRKRHDW